MASYGASVSATVNVENAAFHVLGRGSVARGFTPNAALQEYGLMAALVGSMLTDELDVPGLTVGSSTQMTQFTVYSVSLVPASTVAAKQHEQTFTVTGVTVSDTIFFNPPGIAAAAAAVGCRPSAADTVNLQFIQTAASSTPASGTHLFVGFRCL